MRSGGTSDTPSLKDRLEDALNEARTLILGTQVLLGFQFQTVFEPQFSELSDFEQGACLVGVTLLLANFATLVLPICHAQLRYGGRETARVHGMTIRCVGVALPFFAATLAIDLMISTRAVLGPAAGAAVGAVLAAVALWLWFFAFQSGDRQMDLDTDEDVPLKEKIKQVLTESRIVLPGAQALLGFAGITTLLDAFATLPATGQGVHIAGLLAVTLSIIFLMTPAAVHRVAERGDATPRFYSFAGAMVLVGLGALGLSLACEVYVVMLKVTTSAGWSFLAAGAVAVVLTLLWYVLPIALRGARR